MQKEMKITVLIKYFKEIKYIHPKWKNIDIEIKQKIYESYFEKSKNMTKNSFCRYLKPFWITISRTKKLIQIWEENKPNYFKSFFLERVSRMKL